ncbi:phage scaffolding protein [Lachnospiraceae bacterium EP-SM-12S-S03]|nr:phage scaffolding protein [Lachnospiraceae bacterium EP-SM-12S-S03]
MKTEFLKGLGLEQDVIDKIMAENGKDIAAEKAKTTKAEGERDNYKNQLATATESLEKFKDVDPTAMQSEIDKLTQQLKDKDAEYAAKEADRIFSDTLKEAIKSAGGRNEKSVMALLDMDALKTSKNQSEDIKKALETVKESDAYLFGADEPFSNAVGVTGGTGSGRDDNLSAIRAAMGLPAKKD